MGIEYRPLCKLSKCSTTTLHPESPGFYLYNCTYKLSNIFPKKLSVLKLIETITKLNQRRSHFLQYRENSFFALSNNLSSCCMTIGECTESQ